MGFDNLAALTLTLAAHRKFSTKHVLGKIQHLPKGITNPIYPTDDAIEAESAHSWVQLWLERTTFVVNLKLLVGTAFHHKIWNWIIVIDYIFYNICSILGIDWTTSSSNQPWILGLSGLYPAINLGLRRYLTTSNTR